MNQHRKADISASSSEPIGWFILETSMYRFGLLRYPLWWVELLIGRWEFSRREFLHEEWFDETPCLYCGFLDIAGWRLAQIYILISGRRLACLQGGSEFVCRIRLMNLFSARFAISACGQLQQYLHQWFYCNQCWCICKSFVFIYINTKHYILGATVIYR